MPNPPSFTDLQRAQRQASSKFLSFNNVVNNGSPAAQNIAAPTSTPTPTPTPTPTITPTPTVTPTSTPEPTLTPTPTPTPTRTNTPTPTPTPSPTPVMLFLTANNEVLTGADNGNYRTTVFGLSNYNSFVTEISGMFYNVTITDAAEKSFATLTTPQGISYQIQAFKPTNININGENTLFYFTPSDVTGAL